MNEIAFLRSSDDPRIRLITRLHGIFDRHIKKEDVYLTDREFGRVVWERSDKEYGKFLVDVNE